MKKYIFLTSIMIIIIIISLITVNNYKKSNANNTSTSVNETNFNLAKDSLSVTDPTNINKVFPKDFTLKDLDGNTVTLSDLKGKKVFLNFWATWCPPCKAEMPEIEQLYQETKDSDLVIIAVNIGESKDTVKSFIDNNKYHFKILLDSNNSVVNSYGINSIPTSYFIDTDGYIVSKRTGAMDINQMRENVKALNK